MIERIHTLNIVYIIQNFLWNRKIIVIRILLIVFDYKSTDRSFMANHIKKKTKKRDITLVYCNDNIKKYLQETTLHGLKYLADSSLTIWEKSVINCILAFILIIWKNFKFELQTILLRFYLKNNNRITVEKLLLWK